MLKIENCAPHFYEQKKIKNETLENEIGNEKIGNEKIENENIEMKTSKMKRSKIKSSNIAHNIDTSLLRVRMASTIHETSEKRQYLR